MEVELDNLLAKVGPSDCPALFATTTQPLPSTSSQPHPPAAELQPHPTRFGLKTDKEVEEAKKLAVPKNTERNTTWAVNVWKEWTLNRQKCFPGQSREWPVHLYLAQPQQLDYWLSKFVLETRKENGEHYPPNMLYSICCGLLRYVRDMKPDLNFFKDPAFAGFRKALDSEMKRLTGLGVGVKKKQAGPISIEEESILWEKKLLGDHSPQVLLDTMIFLCGIHFALRSGAEHRDLQISQFELLQ